MCKGRYGDVCYTVYETMLLSRGDWSGSQILCIICSYVVLLTYDAVVVNVSRFNHMLHIFPV